MLAGLTMRMIAVRISASPLTAITFDMVLSRHCLFQGFRRFNNVEEAFRCESNRIREYDTSAQARQNDA